MAFSNNIYIFNQALPVSGVLLSGKLQLTDTYASTAFTLQLFGKADTTYSNSIVSGSVTTDANGDATISFNFGSSIQTPGTYVLRAMRTSGSPALTLVSSDITVGAVGTYIDYLKSTLCAFENIERFEEPAMGNVGYDTFRFGYDNWTSDSPYLSEEDEADTTPGANIKVDYTRGFLYYQTALMPGHDVRATYKFGLFTYNMYLAFFARSLSQINGYKPQTNYSFDTLPPQLADVLIMGAYVKALEAVALKIPTFKYRRLFEDPNALISQINMLLAEARAQFDLYIQKIKRRGSVSPLGVSALKGGGLAFQADGVNWQNFVIGG